LYSYWHSGILRDGFGAKLRALYIAAVVLLAILIAVVVRAIPAEAKKPGAHAGPKACTKQIHEYTKIASSLAVRIFVLWAAATGFSAFRNADMGACCSEPEPVYQPPPRGGGYAARRYSMGDGEIVRNPGEDHKVYSDNDRINQSSGYPSANPNAHAPPAGFSKGVSYAARRVSLGDGHLVTNEQEAAQRDEQDAAKEKNMVQAVLSDEGL
jgi:hypothetical protein